MIVRQGLNASSRYLTVQDSFSSCHFITNDSRGDALLRILADEDLAGTFERRVMMDAYLPPPVKTRSYDAVTLDGTRPVSLNYQFDLMALLRFDIAPEGFSQSPIILCLDYQVGAVQRIMGAQVEVRAISERLPT